MSIKSQDDIPLADADNEAIVDDDTNNMRNGICMEFLGFFLSRNSFVSFFAGQSMDSIPSSCSSSEDQELQDNTPDEQEEKARLITQVLELQNTLDGKNFLSNNHLKT